MAVLKEDEPSAAQDPWSSSNTSTVKDGEKILLELKEHPVSGHWLKGILSLLAVISGALLSGVVLSSWTAAILTALFLVVSNASFFLPSRYVFTEEKLIIDRIIYRKGFQWSRFRCWACDRNGIYLGPGSNPEKFDRFRGVFLVMGRENRERAKSVLQEVIPVAGQQ